MIITFFELIKATLFHSHFHTIDTNKHSTLTNKIETHETATAFNPGDFIDEILRLKSPR